MTNNQLSQPTVDLQYKIISRAVKNGYKWENFYNNIVDWRIDQQPEYILLYLERGIVEVDFYRVIVTQEFVRAFFTSQKILFPKIMPVKKNYAYTAFGTIKIPAWHYHLQTLVLLPRHKQLHYLAQFL